MVRQMGLSHGAQKRRQLKGVAPFLHQHKGLPYRHYDQAGLLHQHNVVNAKEYSNKVSIDAEANTDAPTTAADIVIQSTVHTITEPEPDYDLNSLEDYRIIHNTSLGKRIRVD